MLNVMVYLKASLKTTVWHSCDMNQHQWTGTTHFAILKPNIAKCFAAIITWHKFHQARLCRTSQVNILLPKKASTRQLTPLMALKKIWGSCFKHGCNTTSWGIPLELRNCSWNFGVVLTIAGLLRSTGLLKINRPQNIGLNKMLTDTFCFHILFVTMP